MVFLFGRPEDSHQSAARFQYSSSQLQYKLHLVQLVVDKHAQRQVNCVHVLLYPVAIALVDTRI